MPCGVMPCRAALDPLVGPCVVQCFYRVVSVRNARSEPSKNNPCHISRTPFPRHKTPHPESRSYPPAPSPKGGVGVGCGARSSSRKMRSCQCRLGCKFRRTEKVSDRCFGNYGEYKPTDLAVAPACTATQRRTQPPIKSATTSSTDLFQYLSLRLLFEEKDLFHFYVSFVWRFAFPCLQALE